jgi:hypothetical protein
MGKGYLAQIPMCWASWAGSDLQRPGNGLFFFSFFRVEKQNFVLRKKKRKTFKKI